MTTLYQLAEEGYTATYANHYSISTCRGRLHSHLCQPLLYINLQRKVTQPPMPTTTLYQLAEEGYTATYANHYSISTCRGRLHSHLCQLLLYINLQRKVTQPPMPTPTLYQLAEEGYTATYANHYSVLTCKGRLHSHLCQPLLYINLQRKVTQPPMPTTTLYQLAEEGYTATYANHYSISTCRGRLHSHLCQPLLYINLQRKVTQPPMPTTTLYQLAEEGYTATYANHFSILTCRGRLHSHLCQPLLRINLQRKTAQPPMPTTSPY